jgi:hypothetical protein
MTAMWIAPLLLLPLVGAPLLLRAPFRRFSVASGIVLSGAVGAVLASFVMTVLALADIRWNVSVVAAAATLLGWALSRLPAFSPEPPASAGADRGGAVSRLAAIVSAAAVAASALATHLGAATSPDLFFFWGTKAQQFSAARGIDVAWLKAPFHGFLHPYYPPLATNLGAFASMTAGRFSWEGALWTFPLLVAALAVGLPGTLGGSRCRSAAASALAVSAVALVGIRASVAGNADAPLVVFEALAAAVLLRRDAGDASLQWLGGLLLAGAAATKVEGLPFALAVSALALRHEGARPTLRSAVRLLGPTALTLAAWFAFGAARHLFHEYSEYGPFSALHLDHLPGVLAAIAASLGAIARGLPWIVPALALAAGGSVARAARLPLGAAAVLFAFLAFAYLHLASDPTQWIAWSAARVLMPVPVMFALAIAAPRPSPEPR